ncbi:MAG: hypothetical protein ACRDHL_14830 [Candidatus Promineifilaceae bacterium]
MKSFLSGFCVAALAAFMVLAATAAFQHSAGVRDADIALAVATPLAAFDVRLAGLPANAGGALIGVGLRPEAIRDRPPAAEPTATASPPPTDTPTAAPLTASPSPRPSATPTDRPPTATLAPSPPQPTPTAGPPSPTAAPPQPDPLAINGLSKASYLILPPEVQDHVRELAAQGQAFGRNPRAFSKIGSSTIATYHFLGRWDDGPYNLGAFSYLQPAIDHFQGSFARDSIAAQLGMSAGGALDPAWASQQGCAPNEAPVACELRLHNPAVAVITLGTNDTGSGARFEANMRAIIEYAAGQGVIPILATKADRFEGEDNRNNGIVRGLAVEYRLPLWDFDIVAATLPNHGVGSDGVHMAFYDTYDYTSPSAFQRGYGLFNLTAVMALYEVYLLMPAG